MVMHPHRQPRGIKLLKSYNNGEDEFVCRDGDILRPHNLTEHRVIDASFPEHDTPPHHQSWVRTIVDTLDDLVDPTGGGVITEGTMPLHRWLPAQKRKHPNHIMVGRKFYPDEQAAMKTLGVTEKELKNLLTNHKTKSK